MVVEKSSATLGYAGEISKSLDADHHTICKFTSVQDSNYISVRNALKTLVDTIPSTGMLANAHFGLFKGYKDGVSEILPTPFILHRKDPFCASIDLC
jgi:hypothetical protein